MACSEVALSRRTHCGHEDESLQLVLREMSAKRMRYSLQAMDKEECEGMVRASFTSVFIQSICQRTDVSIRLATRHSRPEPITRGTYNVPGLKSEKKTHTQKQAEEQEATAPNDETKEIESRRS